MADKPVNQNSASDKLSVAQFAKDLGVSGRTIERDHKLYRATEKLKKQGVPEEDIRKMKKGKTNKITMEDHQ